MSQVRFYNVPPKVGAFLVILSLALAACLPLRAPAAVAPSPEASTPTSAGNPIPVTGGGDTPTPTPAPTFTPAGVADTPTPAAPTATQAAPTATVAAPTDAPAQVKRLALKTAKNIKLGTILVDASGMTLYTDKEDTRDVSTCTGNCAATWPPALVQGSKPTAGKGVKASLPGVFTRPDGTQQVTYKGLPLYYFSGDKKPGDVNGDGIGNLWAAAPVNMNLLTFTGLPSPLVCSVPVTGNGTPASNNPSIVIGGNPTLGDFLVDSRYKTLYVFRRDYPGASHCDGECATNWLPYLVQQGSPTIEAGLTGLVGVITRPDGTRQITVNGWPVYYFAGDLKPGDANGDGVNNNWYVIRLNGFPDEPESQDYKGHGHNIY